MSTAAPARAPVDAGRGQAEATTRIPPAELPIRRALEGIAEEAEGKSGGWQWAEPSRCRCRMRLNHD